MGPHLSALALSILVGLPNVRLSPDAPPVPHLQDATLKNVLFVRAGDSTGTAFLLRHGTERLLVTARHVVDGPLEDPSLPLEFFVGGKHGRVIRQVTLVAESARSDIAVFRYDDDPRVPYFPPDAGLVAEGDLHLASQVFLVGYPASLRQTYGSTQLRVVGGWVAGLRKYVPGSTVEYVDIDMPGAELGHSGGPILLLQDRVVAVAVQRHSGSVSESIGATYAVPIKYVTALIDGTPVEEDVDALNEALAGTVLVTGLALQGKSDYDVWAQRLHLETGERVWGDVGIYLAGSGVPEPAFQAVPTADGATLVVYSVVYPQGPDEDVRVQKVSRYGELLFEEGGAAGLAVAVSERPERALAVVPDEAGGAIAFYEVHLEGGDVDVYAQRVSSDGRRLWPDGGAPVSSAPLPERHPRAAPDGAGGAIVVLEVEREGADVDVFAQRVKPDGSRAWLEGKRSAEVAASDRPERHPLLVPDGDGGAIVVYRLESAPGRYELHAQRISRHGELLWNRGEHGVRLHGPGVEAGPDAVGVAADGVGGAFVAFEVAIDPARPDDTDLAVQRLTAGGGVAWGTPVADGSPVPPFAANSPYPERKPSIFPDGQGGIVVAFEAGSAEGDTDVHAQRLDGEGRLRWNEGERSSPVAFTFLTERSPAIVTRGPDRVLVLCEIEKEDGRSVVAAQALSLETGQALYGGGKLPIGVLDAGNLEIQYLLHPREADPAR